METKNIIESYFEEKIRLTENVDLSSIIESYNLIKKTIDSGNQIFCCGNGGSALTASHFVTDWTKCAMQNKNYQFKAICLNDNIGVLTAYSNDISYDEIFSQQLKTYFSKKDLLIVISGSGKSKNLINAVNKANEIGMNTLGILGFDGGELKNLCKLNVIFKTFDMQQAEDFHLSYGHIIMKLIFS